MNRVDTPEGIGNIFFRNLELIYLQEGISEAFRGILAAFSDSTNMASGIRLNGCDVTIDQINSVDTYVLTPGFIYVLGEVFRVDGQQLAVVNGHSVYFDILESNFDDQFPAPIQGGGTHQTRKQRRVILKQSSNVPGDKMDIDSKTFKKCLFDANHENGNPTWFDPRFIDKTHTMSTYFDMGTGEGKSGTLAEGFICLGVYAGTEVYKGRAMVNLDLSDSDFDAVGKDYGSKSHVLGGTEMPPHSHTYTQTNVLGFQGGSSSVGGSDQSYVNSTQNTSKAGGTSILSTLAEPHNNVQSSIVAAFIAKKNPNAFYMP